MGPWRCIVAAACVSLAPAAHAAERRPIDLPAGRLGDALVILGRQAGISIGVTDAALAERRVPRVRGNLTAAEALNRLLRGRGGQAVWIDATTVRIVREQPAAARPTPARPPRPAEPPTPAPAPPPRVEAPEIVVTASRRAVPLQSYPGSAMVVLGEDFALADPSRGADAIVSRLPSIGTTHLGPGRNKLFVRGISESSVHGLTQATIGTYLGETRLNYNAPDPDLRLYDVERIELLLGPQGTLYGAASLGGILRIVPAAPDLERAGASVSAGASLTAHGAPGGDIAAVANVPLAQDRIGLRFNGYAVREGGYIDDLGRGVENANAVLIEGGRLTLRARPDEAWTIDIGGTVQRLRGEDAQYADADTPPLTRRSMLQQNFANNYLLGTIVAIRDYGGLQLLASLGHARQRLSERYDATRLGNPPAAYDVTGRIDLTSAELRLSSGHGEASGWVAGASVYVNDAEQDREVEVNGRRSLRNRVANNVVEAALYGEWGLELLPGLVGTLGGRLTHADLSGSGFAFIPGQALPPAPTEIRRAETRFLPGAAFSFRAAPDLRLYARYQESFRPGGLAIADAEPRQFRSDRVHAVEAGLRYGAPGTGAFDASAAVAHTRWLDIQADMLDIYAEVTPTNLGDGRIYTLDLSLGWRPLPRLGIEAAAVFNESRLTNFEEGQFFNPGSALPNVAPFNGRVAAHYLVPAGGGVGLRFSAAARYTGRSVLGVGEFMDKEQGGWLDITAGVRADIGRHSIMLRVTNLLDTRANRFALGTPFVLDEQNHVTPVRPRSVRLGWEARF